jgi:hypothetical protein
MIDASYFPSEVVEEAIIASFNEILWWDGSSNESLSL